MKPDEEPAALTFDDVAIVPEYSEVISRSEVDLSWKLCDWTFKLPVMAANMPSVCGEAMARKMAVSGGLGVLHREAPVSEFLDIVDRFKEDQANILEGAPLCLSVGSIYNDEERIDFALRNADIICVDMAHGHSKHMKDTLQYIREKDKEIAVIAGNVVTPGGVGNLYLWGASMAKVGVGPGSVCTTRIMTGVGIPQMSAILKTSLGARIPILADGGIRYPGDAAKALAGGAQAVMIGGMLAGTDKTPGWTPDFDSNTMTHSGNASRATKDKNGKTSFVEGVTIPVKKRQPWSTDKILTKMKEGIQSACAYTGNNNLLDFIKHAQLIRVSPSTVKENAPHLESGHADFLFD